MTQRWLSSHIHKRIQQSTDISSLVENVNDILTANSIESEQEERNALAEAFQQEILSAAKQTTTKFFEREILSDSNRCKMLKRSHSSLKQLPTVLLRHCILFIGTLREIANVIFVSKWFKNTVYQHNTHCVISGGVNVTLVSMAYGEHVTSSMHWYSDWLNLEMSPASSYNNPNTFPRIARNLPIRFSDSYNSLQILKQLNPSALPVTARKITIFARCLRTLDVSHFPRFQRLGLIFANKEDVLPSDSPWETDDIRNKVYEIFLTCEAKEQGHFPISDLMCYKNLNTVSLDFGLNTFHHYEHTLVLPQCTTLHFEPHFYRCKFDFKLAKYSIQKLRFDMNDCMDTHWHAMLALRDCLKECINVAQVEFIFDFSWSTETIDQAKRRFCLPLQVDPSLLRNIHVVINVVQRRYGNPDDFVKIVAVYFPKDFKFDVREYTGRPTVHEYFSGDSESEISSSESERLEDESDDMESQDETSEDQQHV